MAHLFTFDNRISNRPTCFEVDSCILCHCHPIQQTRTKARVLLILRSVVLPFLKNKREESPTEALKMKGIGFFFPLCDVLYLREDTRLKDKKSCHSECSWSPRMLQTPAGSIQCTFFRPVFVKYQKTLHMTSTPTLPHTIHSYKFSLPPPHGR